MSRGVLLRLLGVIAVGGAAGAAGWVLSAPEPSSQQLVAAGVPMAWIDWPSGGSLLEPGEPVTVVAHATDPDGIVKVTLTVDDQEVASAGASGDKLVKVELTWGEPAPGRHRLSVVGTDPSGERTGPGVAEIEIGSGGAEPSQPAGTELAAPGFPSIPSPTDSLPAPVPSTSVAPGPSPTEPPPGPAPTDPAPTSQTVPPPTAPPCVPGSVANVAPPDGATVSDRTPTVTWTGLACTPDRYRVKLTFTTGTVPFTVEGVVAGNQTSWTVPDTQQLSCGGWTMQVRAEVGSAAGPWSAVTRFTVWTRPC